MIKVAVAFDEGAKGVAGTYTDGNSSMFIP